MRKILNALRRIRLVPHRSRPVTKMMILCAVVLSTLALLTLRAAIVASEDRIDALQKQALTLEEENQNLEQRIDRLDTEEGIRQIAEEELGLVDPNTVVIVPQQ